MFYTGVVLTCEILIFVMFLVIVENSAHAGGNEEDPGLSTSNGLSIVEDESEVAVDIIFLKLFRGLDAFPGGCNLY